MGGGEEGESVGAVSVGFGAWVECVAGDDDGSAVACRAARLGNAA